MKSDYRIEELISQSANVVVYRASGKDGQVYALTRLVLSDDVADGLTDEQFASALAQLKELEHPCLRRVFDGGLDEVDRQPWFANQWWEGETLEDRLLEETFSEADLHRLQGLSEILFKKMASYAGAISFQTNEIVSTTSADGSAIETFTVDLYQWMDDWIMGSSPGSTINPKNRLTRLLNVIQGPPIARPVFPAVIEPPAVVPLASAQSDVGSGKVILMIAGLSAVLVVAFFVMKKKTQPAEEVVEMEDRPPAIEQAAPSPTPASSVRPIEKSVSASGRPPKPPFESLQENNLAFADQEERLSEFIGQWVNVLGRVQTVSDEGEWVFEMAVDGEQPLKARLERPSDLKVTGKGVSVVGFLEKSHLLKIPQIHHDTVITDPELLGARPAFGVQDEQEIMRLSGRIIRIEATVKQVNVIASGAYLHFKEPITENALAGKIWTSNFSKTHDLAFFQSLKGKKVSIIGKVTRSTERRGWYVVFERNMDIKIVGSEGLADNTSLTPDEPEKKASPRPSEPDTTSSKAEYTTRDIAKIKLKHGKEITVRGKVLGLTPSGNGETFYLNFTGRRPVLDARFVISDAEASLDETFLKSLIGREIAVTGTVVSDFGGSRIGVSITRKDQISQ